MRLNASRCGKRAAGSGSVRPSRSRASRSSSATPAPARAGRGLVGGDHDALDARGRAERGERQRRARSRSAPGVATIPRVAESTRARPAFSSGDDERHVGVHAERGRDVHDRAALRPGTSAPTPARRPAPAQNSATSQPRKAPSESARDAQLLSLELDRRPGGAGRGERRGAPSEGSRADRARRARRARPLRWRRRGRGSWGAWACLILLG